MSSIAPDRSELDRCFPMLFTLSTISLSIPVPAPSNFEMFSILSNFFRFPSFSKLLSFVSFAPGTIPIIAHVPAAALLYFSPSKFSPVITP